MSKVIIPDGINMQTLAFIISEALSIEDLELFMIELNALIAIKKSKKPQNPNAAKRQIL